MVIIVGYRMPNIQISKKQTIPDISKYFLTLDLNYMKN